MAFLPAHGVPPGVLLRALELSRQENVRPEAALLAQGLLPERDYFAALARHLGLELADDDPGSFGPDAFAPVSASSGKFYPQSVLAGVVPLVPVDGAAAPRWLLSPAGARLDELLILHRTGRLPRERFVLATPGFLQRLVFAQNGEVIAHRAAHDLSARDPLLSAQGMNRRPSWLLLAMIMAAVAGLTALGSLWLAISLACGSLLASAILVRLFATAASCDAERLQRYESGGPPLSDQDLPVYTVIVAIYREAEVVHQLTEALSAFDYPASKLDIKIIAEQDDTQTLHALAALELPPRFQILVAPAGAPRTKPRALNIALPLARGSLLCIFDAEDIPQPHQLREAANSFANSPQQLACVQARLAIDNFSDSWLAACFAIEYASLFDVINPGLAELGLPVPLGGTSNHFRTEVLRQTGGWDAWNVTEDIDLGLRLARFGYRTAVIGSSTDEEAPAVLAAWMRQRRRWFKGWMQTLIVHMRQPRQTIAGMGGLRATVALSHVGGALLGAMLGPVFIGLALYDAMAGDLLNPSGVWSVLVSTCWCFILIAGIASAIWPLWLGIRRRRLQEVAPLAVLMPLYWMLQTIAAWWALADLIRAPFHWLKTHHGLAKTSRRKGATGL